MTAGAEEDLDGAQAQDGRAAAGAGARRDASHRPCAWTPRRPRKFEQLDQAEQDELAQALAELEAQEQQELRVKR